MEVFLQQLINGITLGSIYGLIAIGYTMVFGIIGMVNFAHGDVFMVSAFIALIAFLILTTWLGVSSMVLALFIVLVVAMVLTSLVNWTIERVAYRPLRGSFRLAPLISAIGMSIFLSNFVQVAQGPRNKSIPPMLHGVIVLMERQRLRRHAVLQADHHLGGDRRAAGRVLVPGEPKTSLGRAQRACEQDQKMAALLGVDVDRTISITFVIGAALAAVAGTMYLMYYGVVNFSDGFVPGVKAFTAAVLGGIGSLPGAVLGGLLIGLIETMWSAYFSIDYKDVAAFSILAITLIFLPQGLLGRPGRREGLRWHDDACARSSPALPRARPSPCVKPRASSRCRVRLFLPLIGFKTVQNIRNELVLETRFGCCSRSSSRSITAGAPRQFARGRAMARAARGARPRKPRDRLAGAFARCVRAVRARLRR